MDGVPAAFSKVSFVDGGFATRVKLIKNEEQIEISFFTTKDTRDSNVLDVLLDSFKFVK